MPILCLSYNITIVGSTCHRKYKPTYDLFIPISILGKKQGNIPTKMDPSYKLEIFPGCTYNCITVIYSGLLRVNEGPDQKAEVKGMIPKRISYMRFVYY